MAKSQKKQILNREISWLSFNARVLQEAKDPSVPLIERIKFLGIFSSNLDEFFSIRVAALKKLVKNKLPVSSDNQYKPNDVLNNVLDTVLHQQNEFEIIYNQLLDELEKEDIYIINESEVSPEQARHIKQYFHEKVLPSLVPILLDDLSSFPYLRDRNIYLAVRMSHRNTNGKKNYRHALIQLPSAVLPRFFEIPSIKSNKRYIMLLDNVIRFCLSDVFHIFPHDDINAWTIKLTRDAELKIDNDYSTSLINRVTNSLKNRKKGEPSRFVYDHNIPAEFLALLTKRMRLNKQDLIPGGRYHNFRDFVKFPSLGRPDLAYPRHEALDHPVLRPNQSILNVIGRQDAILHLPYHKYDYVIQYIREAAIDPKVKTIKITLYRVAENSYIVNALLNAIRNGKQVTVVMEITARFDEESNIYWAQKLTDEGATVIYGREDMKVHSKLCLVSREENGKLVRYCNLGTGNFNESTARLYCDHSLFTANPKIVNEVARLFSYIEGKKVSTVFKNIIVSPFNPRDAFIKLINNEIAIAKKDREAHIIVKLNHIVDKVLIERLYAAAEAGVKVDVIARTTCTMLPLNDNIRIISIIDRFLEHARVYYFYNNGRSKLYLSSSDWMSRNLDHRIEVSYPLLDHDAQLEVLKILNFQLNDNVKARIISKKQDNAYVSSSAAPLRSQYATFNYLLND